MKYAGIFLFLLFLPKFLPAHPSWGIVVDPQRNIYFADITHYGMGAVWKLTKDGELKLLLKDFHAHNVSLDQDANLVTAHGENNHTMIKLYPSGAIDTLHHVYNYKDFFGGNCTYSPRGEILFNAEHYIWKINEKKVREKVSGHRFEWSQTIYAAPDGTIYAPDIGLDNGVLVKIDTLGNSEIIARDLISKLDRPRNKHNDILLGITEGCDGHIYIAELAGKRIIKIAENKNPETFYQSKGDWFPTAIDFFAGDAYILEYKSKNGSSGPRIIKIDESGNYSELFDYDKYQRNRHTIIKHPENGNKRNWSIYVLIGFLGLVAAWAAIKKMTAYN